MAEKEEWRDVVGSDGEYQVSSLGRVRNSNTKHILSTFAVDGYRLLSVKKNGKRMKQRVHRLVAEAFLENPEGKEYVDHINGIVDDNRVENLRWVTHSENISAAIGKRVVCKEVNMEFNSVLSAARWVAEKNGLPFTDLQPSISKACHGEMKTAYGYHWAFAEDDMSKMSREKGKRGEREIANILKERGYDAKRGVQYQGSPDSPDVVGLPGVHIEVKRSERLDLYDAIEQSKRDSGDNEMPAVFHRKNGKDWVAILRLEDFLKLYEGTRE